MQAPVVVMSESIYTSTKYITPTLEGEPLGPEPERGASNISFNSESRLTEILQTPTVVRGRLAGKPSCPILLLPKRMPLSLSSSRVPEPDHRS
jgi:hypothetical protein